MKIFLRESSGITPPPVQPPSGDIQIPSFPAGFTFQEGVPATISLAQYIAGGPILTTINRFGPVSDDVGLSGIAYNATTNTLTYDGTLGIGTGHNFVVNASDGTDPVSEVILPSSVTHTWNGPSQAGSTGKFLDAISGLRSALVGGVGGTIEMFFANRLGDWWDGSYPPVRQGTKPFYQFVTTPNFSGPQTSTNAYDVTKLVQMWQSGEIPNYGIFTQRVSGNADVYFSSPAFSSGAEGPFMALTYADGTTETITATNTEGITATAEGNSLNTATRWPQDNGICYFELSSKIKRIRSATWTVVAHNAYGAATFNVMALRWEGQTAGDVPTWGYAQNYPADVNIQADASTIFVERFQDINFFTRGSWFKLGGSWNHVPLSDFQYIVGDTDPHSTHYVPLKAGIPAIKWIIPAGNNAGKRMDFSFWGLFGNGPAIQSNYQDIRECYVRWYERYDDDFIVKPPEEGGHSTGLAGEYIDGTWRNGTVVPQTGRYLADQRYQGADLLYAAVTNYRSLPDYTLNPMAQYGVSNMNAYTYDLGSGGGGSGLVTNMNYNNTHRGLRLKNRWYCIEQYLRVNDPGVANGIIRFWVDGRIALNRTNSQMVSLSYAGVTNLSVQWYYGGVGLTPNQLSQYMTMMVISRSYIGPALLGAPT